MAKKKLDKETERTPSSPSKIIAIFKNKTVHFVIGLMLVIFSVYLLLAFSSFFFTGAAEFCAFLERAERMKRSDFVDTSLKILPLLYLKASMLPKCETIGEEVLETYVTEEIYEILRINLAELMGDKDDYLDVFVQDMVYSDQPIKKSISEDLADIYQDIKDFIFVFQLGLNETMNDSLAVCQENFGMLWGQKLVNTLRALHDVKYSQQDEEDNEEGFYEPSDDGNCCEDDECHCHDDDCHCHENGCHCHHDE